MGRCAFVFLDTEFHEVGHGVSRSFLNDIDFWRTRSEALRA